MKAPGEKRTYDAMRNLALSIALAAAMAGDASAQPLQVAQASAPPIQPLRPTPRPIRLPAEISSQHAIYVQARVNGSASSMALGPPRP